MQARRCNSEACGIEAVKRSTTLDMPLATVLENPAKEWQRLAYGGVRIAKRIIDVDWKEFNQDNYLFSHCSIVCSVEVEENGYYIKPCCSELVNNNGNSWATPVLLATFKSFVGGENYLEHVQIPSLSKGKIIDAVARPVCHKNSLGEANVLWIDILVATDRKHEELVKKIASGELSTMSMGCLADWVTCSKCGKVLSDTDKNCPCLDGEIRQYFTDKNGIKRIVSEMCGRMHKNAKGEWVGDPKSVKFIEASWVERPAFVGAVLNHYVSELPKMANILNFNNARLADCMDDIFKLRVADVTGMTVLRVARAEYLRRQREEMIGRVAKSLYWAK